MRIYCTNRGVEECVSSLTGISIPLSFSHASHRIRPMSTNPLDLCRVSCAAMSAAVPSVSGARMTHRPRPSVSGAATAPCAGSCFLPRPSPDCRILSHLCCHTSPSSATICSLLAGIGRTPRRDAVAMAGSRGMWSRLTSMNVLSCRVLCRYVVWRGVMLCAVLCAVLWCVVLSAVLCCVVSQRDRLGTLGHKRVVCGRARPHGHLAISNARLSDIHCPLHVRLVCLAVPCLALPCFVDRCTARDGGHETTAIVVVLSLSCVLL